eukprot:6858852-Pyramimonas_sp.AAC.1
MRSFMRAERLRVARPPVASSMPPSLPLLGSRAPRPPSFLGGAPKNAMSFFLFSDCACRVLLGGD